MYVTKNMYQKQILDIIHDRKREEKTKKYFGHQ